MIRDRRSGRSDVDNHRPDLQDDVARSDGSLPARLPRCYNRSPVVRTRLLQRFSPSPSSDYFFKSPLYNVLSGLVSILSGDGFPWPSSGTTCSYTLWWWVSIVTLWDDLQLYSLVVGFHGHSLVRLAVILSGCGFSWSPSGTTCSYTLWLWVFMVTLWYDLQLYSPVMGFYGHTLVQRAVILSGDG